MATRQIAVNLKLPLRIFKSPPSTVSLQEPTEVQHPEETNKLPLFCTVLYITSKSEADDALGHIRDGEVGFDTEFADRGPTREERAILKALSTGANKKTALLGWQIVELSMHHHPWRHGMGSRYVKNQRVPKAGVGILKDISVVWDDMRMEMCNVADTGMMARLLLAEKLPKQAYSNLSLKTSVEEVLGFSIEKDLAQSDWSATQLTKEQIEYAARDAIASLHLYQILKVRLEDKREELSTAIPEGWYTFNSRLGDPTCTRLAADGTEVIWKLSDCTWNLDLISFFSFRASVTGKARNKRNLISPSQSELTMISLDACSSSGDALTAARPSPAHRLQQCRNVNFEAAGMGGAMWSGMGDDMRK
ncbi:ribonuclease H-like domain-containing protein [Mycena leptocephala]|nr:ribonuclease H-like domain-containing protein [Mycena leptocephala]